MEEMKMTVVEPAHQAGIAFVEARAKTEEMVRSQAAKERVKESTIWNRIRRRNGFNPQKSARHVRPAFSKGDQVAWEAWESERVIGVTNLWIERVKSDGRLRCIWSGNHPDQGTTGKIGAQHYLVAHVSPRLVYLNPINQAEAQNSAHPAAEVDPGTPKSQETVTGPQQPAGAIYGLSTIFVMRKEYDVPIIWRKGDIREWQDLPRAEAKAAGIHAGAVVVWHDDARTTAFRGRVTECRKLGNGTLWAKAVVLDVEKLPTPAQAARARRKANRAKGKGE